jgi:hypothetical protein
MYIDNSKSNASILKIIGKALMLGSQQYALGSVLMSSTFSVRNFSKDQETLQAAADALVNYIYMGVLWTLSNVMVLGASYGTVGGVSAVVSNAAIMLWMYVAYLKAFKIAQDKHGLQRPKLF